MRVLAVRAPFRSDGPSPERARPILPVKGGNGVEAYAVYDQGSYKFPIDKATAEELETGRLTVVYEIDCGAAVALRLVSDPQLTGDVGFDSEPEEFRVYTDQDPGSSS